VTMPLLIYFGWVGSFLVAALFATCWWFSGNVAYVPPLKGPLSESIHIRIHSDHKWPERVVFDTARWRLAPAESAEAETEPQGQKPAAVEAHSPVGAFAEMGRQAIEDCLEPACQVDQNMESDVSPKRQASVRRSRRTRAAKAFTAPNPFHKLPGKS
jgi:hypothetical protein